MSMPDIEGGVLTTTAYSLTQAVGGESKGENKDSGKLLWQLLPFDALEQVVRVFSQAVESGKYAPRNWERGLEWERQLGSLLRHAARWQQGEDTDSESGLPHMAHVATRALMLLAYEQRGVGVDDRPKGGVE